ncbi:unnamed protein product, partial [Phaeothamnion confervicola]
VLDPTGRAGRVEPSAVTTLRDGAFGLGYDRHPRKDAARAMAVVAAVAALPQHRGVGLGEFARLVPTIPSSDGKKLESETGAAAAGAGSSGAKVVSLGEAARVPGVDLDFFGGVAALSDDDGGYFSNDGGDGSGSAMTGEGKNGRLPPPRELSKLELAAVATVQERRQRRLAEGVTQAAAGRVFSGGGFRSSSDPVRFEDFEYWPGIVHVRRIMLTNISLTFNAFKPLEVPPALLDVLAVEYAKAGRVAAGVACPVDVVFKPAADQDLRAELPFLSETGPFVLRVECTARRPKPSLEQPFVEFGETVTGEVLTAFLGIINDGPLPAAYRIVCVPVEGEGQVEEGRVDAANGEAAAAMAAMVAAPGGGDRGDDGSEAGKAALQEAEVASNALEAENAGFDEGSAAGESRSEEKAAPEEAVGDGGSRTALASALSFTPTGTVEAFSRTKHLLRFAPQAAGAVRWRLIVVFEGVTTPSPTVLVSAIATPPPLFTEPGTLDFRCCVVGKTYRTSVRLCNRGRVAVRFDVSRAAAAASSDATLKASRGGSSGGGSASSSPRRRTISSSADPMGDCLSVAPTSGFVPPGGFLSLALKFQPSAGLLERAAAAGLAAIVAAAPPQRPPRDTIGLRNIATLAVGAAVALPGRGVEGSIAVPIWFHTLDQAEPARLELRARLTSSVVTFKPPRLNFGGVSLGQVAARRLRVQNAGALPQRLGFVRVPSHASVRWINAAAADDGNGGGGDGSNGDSSGSGNSTSGGAEFGRGCFGVLLPYEERELEVAFAPAAATEHVFDLAVETSLGAAAGRLPCRGCGQPAVLLLTPAVLQFAPACGGDAATANVTVENASGATQAFEVLVPRPKLSALVISPRVAVLKPGEKLCMEVAFRPPASCQPPAAGAATAGDAAGTLGGIDEANARVQPHEGTLVCSSAGEPWSLHATWRVPIFLRPLWHAGDTGGSDDGAKSARPGVERGAAMAAVPPLCLEVQTVVVPRLLVASSTLVVFGQVAVGEAATRTVRIANYAATPADLRAAGPNPAGPFCLLKALRTIPVAAKAVPATAATTIAAAVGNGAMLSGDGEAEKAGAARTGQAVPAALAAAAAEAEAAAVAAAVEATAYHAVLRFQPEYEGVFAESVVIHCRALGQSVRLELRGEGLRPALRVEPADGGIDFGGVLEGDTARREVTLHNDSSFPLRYCMEPRMTAHPNHNGVEPFALVPHRGEIPPGANQKMAATFSPDHHRLWPLRQTFAIVVPGLLSSSSSMSTAGGSNGGSCGSGGDSGGSVSGARNPKLPALMLSMQGRCWARQAYVEANGQGAVDSWQRRPEALDDALAGGSSAAPAPPPPQILLNFPRDGMKTTAQALAGAAPSIGAGTISLSVRVGCLAASDPKRSAAASFEVELDAEAKALGCFRVAPEKGNVAPGAVVPVIFTFAPSSAAVAGAAGAGATAAGAPAAAAAAATARAAAARPAGVLEPGQWLATTAFVHVKGGWRPEGTPEVETVRVRLEAYLPA